MSSRYPTYTLIVALAGSLGACSKGSVQGFEQAFGSSGHGSSLHDDEETTDAGVNDAAESYADNDAQAVDGDAGDAAVPVDLACAPKLCESGDALPEGQVFLGEGLCARKVASDQGELGKLVVAPNGYLFGIKSSGHIYRYLDVSCDGRFDANPIENFEWAFSGGRGDDLAFDPKFSHMYATSPDGVVRWTYCFDQFGGGKAQPVVVGQPTDGHSELRIDAEWLYVKWTPEEGATDASVPCVETTKRFPLAAIDSQDPFDWSEGEDVVDAADGGMFADGVELPEAWDWHWGDVENEAIQPLGLAKSPKNGATYVTIAVGSDDATSDGAIYRIAATR